MKIEAREKGYVMTLFNRRRFIPDIRDHRRTVREAAERRAINMPIQGTAADMIKIAMIQLHRHIHEQGMDSRMIIQVHDELVFEIPRVELETMQQVIRSIMENAVHLDVPVTVDIDTGNNWAEIK